MKCKFVSDLKENSYILYPNTKPDPTGLIYQVQYTGYENIGVKYHLERSEYESFMLTYTISGTHNMIYDGKYYNIKPDTLMFIDCLKPHETWGDPAGYVILYMHIFNPYLSDFCNFIHKVQSPVIGLNGDKIGFKELVLNMHDDIKNNTFDQIAYSKKIYAMLLKLKDLTLSSSAKLVEIPDHINELIGYISKNYNQKLTLEYCAKIATVTPNYLESVFKKYTGVTVGKYISALRLKQAQRLLITTQKSVVKIANEVGLDDSQVLIRLFRKHLGITPLAYRKLHHEKIK